MAYPCPCCGFVTFQEPPGSFEICDICNWEDDALQLSRPKLRGGANKMSLLDSQKEILEKLPVEVKDAQGFHRDPKWRPLEKSDLKPPSGSGIDFASYDDDDNGAGEVREEAEVVSDYYWLRPE